MQESIFSLLYRLEMEGLTKEELSSLKLRVSARADTGSMDMATYNIVMDNIDSLVKGHRDEK